MKRIMPFQNRSLILLACLLLVNAVSAQVDSGVTPFLPAAVRCEGLPCGTFINDLSGDGRFVVFESNQNLATVNPRNTDGNTEIFLFDAAQRHIFQITNTKHALRETNGSTTDFLNVRILLHNNRPVISNDGKWIAFGSNGTTSPGTDPPSPPNGTNPGNFDGNTPGYLQILEQDANMEIWLYQLPTFQPVDMATGETPPFIDLGAGTFTQATNTPTSYLPAGGSNQPPPNPPIYPGVGDDNHDASINDDGSTIAFNSGRDLEPPLNGEGLGDNAEIFVYKRATNTNKQITVTPRGPISNQIYNKVPTISGDGTRVMFASTGVNPVPGMVGGTNVGFNMEIYYADLDSSGAPIYGKQLKDTPADPGEIVNSLTFGESMSRDGRYIVYSSAADLTNENGGANYNENKANYVYDADTGIFRRMGPRENADGSVPFGIDNHRYAHFSGYPTNSRTPTSIIFSSRMNFRTDGTVPPAGSSEGLNPSPSRPSQVFSFNLTNTSTELKRLSNSSLITPMLNSRCFGENSGIRIVCTQVNSQDALEGHYFLVPTVTMEDTNAAPQFFTGASALSVSSTPQQAAGLIPGMLGSVAYSSQTAPSNTGFSTNVLANRNFVAPIQYKGVSLSIDGVAASITGVANGRVNFIVPKGLTPGNKPVVINNNGVVIRGTVPIIQTYQPDVVRTAFNPSVPGPFGAVPAEGGRAFVLNVTDPDNPIPEPFYVTTQTPGGLVPTKLRLHLTGVEGATAGSISIQIGNVAVPNALILTDAVQSIYPGIFMVDFEMPQQLNGAGNVPIVVTVGGVNSRAAATASRINVLTRQEGPTDLAVWRPGDGYWYILDNGGSTPIYMPWGSATDYAAPGDYDGDGETDFCVFRPSTSQWWIYRSSDGGFSGNPFGMQGDKPAQADYDGDGKTDIAVFRPSDGVLYIYRSSDSQVMFEYPGGDGENLVPADQNLIPADYDGDGVADVAVWKNSTATFWIKRTTTGLAEEISFGDSGDRPVVGDYDGDGKADLATWRGSDNTWRIKSSATGNVTSYQWGDFSVDVPVQGDYDADGMTDIGVWRWSGPSVGLWNIRKSSDGQQRTDYWGATGDIPVPARW